MIDIAELAERVIKELVRWLIIAIVACGGVVWLRLWEAA